MIYNKKGFRNNAVTFGKIICAEGKKIYPKKDTAMGHVIRPKYDMAAYDKETDIVEDRYLIAAKKLLYGKK